MVLGHLIFSGVFQRPSCRAEWLDLPTPDLLRNDRACLSWGGEENVPTPSTGSLSLLYYQVGSTVDGLSQGEEGTAESLAHHSQASSTPQMAAGP